MKNMKFTKMLTTIFAASIIVAGCSQATTATSNNSNSSSSSELSTSNSDTVNIGGLWELTGATAAYGVVQDNAVQLAVEQRNEEGGIDGKEVSYQSYDNQGAPEEAA